jgi:hypothetical protein
MSGGHWNYQNDVIAQDIFGWHMSPNYGERGFKQAALARKSNPLEDKQLSELAWDLFCILHSYDWCACGDTGEEDYRKDVAYLKKKWLKASPEELARREIDTALEETRQELYESLGVKRDA